jgi:hypothetical protein
LNKYQISKELFTFYQLHGAQPFLDADGRSVCEGTIQSVPGEKVNIPGDHSIGHSKKTVYMNMCPIPNGSRDRAL